MRVELWTDGSGTTPGHPGGWAYILRAISTETGEVLKESEGAGYEFDTTNNRMEMTALLMGLRALTRRSVVMVYTDSEYVMLCYQGRYRKKKNRDLWDQIMAVGRQHVVGFCHVLGHTGIALNERCDKLAGEQRRKAIEILENRQAGVVIEDVNAELKLDV